MWMYCGDGIGWLNAQVQRDTGLWYSAEYSTFSISDDAAGYRMTVAGYSGDAGDALRAHSKPEYNSNGKRFSTRDRDNDGSTNNCAANKSNGWWYDRCSRSILTQNSVAVWTTVSAGPGPRDVQASRMLVKIN